MAQTESVIQTLGIWGVGERWEMTAARNAGWKYE